MSNDEVVKLFTAQIENLKKHIKPQHKQKYYSYKEASELLRISVEGLKTRIKRGQMIRVVNGNRPLINQNEISRWLKTQNPQGLE
jgi:2-C-methyl-D-erythritol 4-phosphate cytidylyltransferase